MGGEQILDGDGQTGERRQRLAGIGAPGAQETITLGAAFGVDASLLPPSGSLALTIYCYPSSTTGAADGSFEFTDIDMVAVQTGAWH